MRIPWMVLICFFLFTAAVWFVEPLGAPNPAVAEAGIVTGIVMFLGGMGAWLVVLGIAGEGSPRGSDRRR